MNVSTLPIGPSQRRLLTCAGFSELEDFKDITPTQLSEELHITCEEALGIIKTVKSFTNNSNGEPRLSAPTTAFDLLEKEKNQGSIVTFCECLDNMLGGGIPVGKITEFCGAPGVGKTQMGMQLVVDVQIPNHFGGLEGKAIYIDTEGSFIVERVCEISTAVVTHLHEVNEVSMKDEGQTTNLEHFSMESILSNIIVYRCHDYVQLIAVSHLLPDILKEHKEVKLIIVDSIAFPFRHDFDDLALRTRILNGLAQSFIKIAHDHDLAVVFMNQMTTRVKKDKHQQSSLVPALGESWGHACTIRIILFWEGNSRLANLYKSPSKKEMTVPFNVTCDGIRGVALQSSPSGPTEPEQSMASTQSVARNDHDELLENRRRLKRTFDDVS